MAKKNDLLGDILEAFGDEGGNLFGDLLEQVTGSSEAASMGDELLDGLMENGGGILQGLGDVVSDLTGLGVSNTDASETAKLTGKTKSSAAKKKTTKTTARPSAKKTEKKETAKKETAKKETAKKKTAASSAAKKKSSAAKKKSN